MQKGAVLWMCCAFPAFRRRLLHMLPCPAPCSRRWLVMMTCSAKTLQEEPGRGTLPGVVGWVLRHRRALTISYLVSAVS
jgi:hypothetical protein